MDRALWLLLWLRFRGWSRRLGRSLRTPKGAALAVLGLLLFVPMLVSMVLTAAIPEARVGDPQTVRHYGPLLLLGYCFTMVLFASADRGLTFTPAEVDFLFPGPFSRRQVLAYKIAGTLLGSLLSTLFLSVFMRTYAVQFAAALIGLFLTVTFLQLFNIVVALVIGTLGVLVYNRARKFLLLAVVVLILAVVWPLGRQTVAASGVERIIASPVAAVLLTPLRCFVEAFTAERLWPDLVQWGLLALAVNGVLLGVVFALDAHYLEAAAAASEQHYARLQRMRQGGSAITAKRGRIRLSLPSLPWWNGAGPIMWRQALTALRGTQGPALFLPVLIVAILVPFVGMPLATEAPRETVSGLLVMMMVLSVFLLPTMIRFDFRGDLDRMGDLKALPLPPLGLVLGQLAVPVAIGSFIQLLLLAVLAVLEAEVRAIALGVVAFVLPGNFLFYAVENLVFLAYPTRMVPASPGDFQHLGRHVLVMAVKGMLLTAAVLVLALAAAIAYFVSGGSWLGAGLVAWFFLIGIDAALLPGLVFCFHRFDVSRDTPP